MFQVLRIIIIFRSRLTSITTDGKKLRQMIDHACPANVDSLFTLSVAFGANYEDIFKENADGIFASLIGDPSKINHSVPLSVIKKHNNDIRQMGDDKMDKKKLTTEKTIAATEHKDSVPSYNMTMDDMILRKRNINIARLLNQKQNPIPDFANNADDPGIITRRFDAIRTKVTTYRPKSDLRQEYFYWENETRIYTEKSKTVALMEHYIYEARYKLPYAQLLRIKYKDHIRYKIGYLFALMRQLKQQQMTIYSALVNNYLRTLTLHFHIKIYEKVVRLNVDLKDVIFYIKQLERHRKLMDDPTYYDDDDRKR